MSRADRISSSEWERNKEHIRSLYLDQDKSLDDLVTSMAEQHGFHASRAQYIRKLGTWNIKKYSSKDNWKRADGLIRKRKVDGKDTEIVMNGKLVSAKKLKKELGRYAWQQPYGQQPSNEHPRNAQAQLLSICNPSAVEDSLAGWLATSQEFRT
ncbi:hypothetical protein N0V84_009329 [Fusarium piperis]|uniref:Clr5 domain-containing protein n=1 Tax=Fusarium piperis TaxID=1435070 RepID=A0A9W8W6H6_9HYPO|nr:hypothetical protein N0V84_009329 [Fusarium piperis]